MAKCNTKIAALIIYRKDIVHYLLNRALVYQCIQLQSYQERYTWKKIQLTFIHIVIVTLFSSQYVVGQGYLEHFPWYKQYTKVSSIDRVMQSIQSGSIGWPMFPDDHFKVWILAWHHWRTKLIKLRTYTLNLSISNTLFSCDQVLPRSITLVLSPIKFQ